MAWSGERRFPDYHDLVAFFEVEPALTDPGVHWWYNTLRFLTKRGRFTIDCEMSPAYGDLQVRVSLDEHQIASLFANQIIDTTLEVARGREALLAVSYLAGVEDTLILQLRPEVSVWQIRRPRP